MGITTKRIGKTKKYMTEKEKMLADADIWELLQNMLTST